MPTELRFHLPTLRDEVKTLPSVAGELLDPVGAHRIEAAIRAIESAAAHPDKQFTWKVSEEEPILTAPSQGEWESRNKEGREKGKPVIGALSFKWQLRTATGKPPINEAFLDGMATTKIRLIDPSDDSQISMWRMEIGPEDAPGCCFHIQVLGQETTPPFPEWLPVPRLPSLPPTPMACLEFLLAELFQHRWSQLVRSTRPETRMWRGMQKTRLMAFLDWQREIVEKTEIGSPLVRLKGFPDPAKLPL